MSLNENLEERVTRAMDCATIEFPPHSADLVRRSIAQGRRMRLFGFIRIAVAVCAVAIMGGSLLAADVFGIRGDGTPDQLRAGAPMHSAEQSPSPGTSPESGNVAVIPAAPPSSPVPYRTPMHAGQPLGEGEDSMADLPPAERERQEEFRQRVTATLNRTLGGTLGEIRPWSALSIRLYQAEKNGRKYPLIFSVRPGYEPAAKGCPSTPVETVTCNQAVLPGGIPAEAVTIPMGEDGKTHSTDVTFAYGRSTVILSVAPDAVAGVSAPITGEQLLAVAGDSELLELVREADELSVLKNR
ncbi:MULTISPECIES: hypothetical protein [unclassified Streptomyces]|uniref:hypothetical protein n=1 Tax=unclassified Streptomyces TaxID=2593676 RepID=UPI0003717304|nr:MULTISPECIES: hypothetical protein [unclassified Streptomyces]MYX37482.1 hypothetical protein [Streptomyces sp. SID8377]